MGLVDDYFVATSSIGGSVEIQCFRERTLDDMKSCESRKTFLGINCVLRNDRQALIHILVENRGFC